MTGSSGYITEKRRSRDTVAERKAALIPNNFNKINRNKKNAFFS